MTRFLPRALLLAGILGVSTTVADIVTTKHNLSVSGPGDIKATEETQICIFCHTPHGASPDGPLWNRRDPGQTYIPYSSSTAQATPGQPTGASILCLSCHDGTIALGDVLSRETPILMSGSQTLPEGSTNLGTDLSDDHPISFFYSSAVTGIDSELVPPAALTEPIKLDATGQLQCTSCHDPHNDDQGKFLLLSAFRGELCIACHDLQLSDSPHLSAPNTWDGIGIDPWPDSDWDSVDANACLNCHTPHSAGGPRLLRSAVEEANCLICHNGHVATTDIEQVLNKLFVHPVRDTTGVHDPTEDIVVNERHVECPDCHDPHVAGTTLGTEDDGTLAHVSGVSISGVEVYPIDHEYELCFRCHGDSTGKAPPYVRRVVNSDDNNVRREFDPSNLSYHPVAAAGRNADVPSLIPPLTTTSIIRCTDCHNNDGTVGPRGPHGSDYPALLERQYVTNDRNPESAADYALCYKCHDRISILSDRSFSLHSRHILGGGSGSGQGQATPCSVCHDPHGVSPDGRLSGERLINFDDDVVEENNAGELYYESLGIFSGTCSLRCHGKNHRNCVYDETSGLPGPGGGGGCAGG